MLSDTVVVAIVAGGASVLTAAAGFASNVYWLGSMLTGMRQDIKDLTGAVTDLDKRVTRIEIKLGIQP